MGDVRAKRDVAASRPVGDAHLDDPYRAPASDAHRRTPSWLRSRPWPVYPIALLCAVPFCALGLVLLQQGAQLMLDVRAGVVSPWNFAGSLFVSTLLFVGGLFLVFLRKAAIWLFALSLPWIAYRTFAGDTLAIGSTMLATILFAIGYGLWLQRRGHLR